MSFETIFQISQIFAVFAILASLVFVGIQVRQSTAQSKVAAAEAVHRSFSDWYYAQADPAIGPIIVKGLQNTVALSAVERWTFSAMMMTFLLNAQDAHSKWIDGSLTDDRWGVWDGIGGYFFKAPGSVEMWNIRGYMFSEGFQVYAQTKIDEQGIIPDEAHSWRAPAEPVAAVSPEQ
jgi:hypothetical protein